MTRTVPIGNRCCYECGHCYDTIEEAIECEELDREERLRQEEYDREQEEWEILTEAELEQQMQESDPAYLVSVYGKNFL
jgi:hypothetical protein